MAAEADSGASPLRDLREDITEQPNNQADDAAGLSVDQPESHVVEPIAPPPPVKEKEPRKRPKLDLNIGGKKGGRNIFGVLVGTLNKAKLEDKARNATEAAKKRQLIDQRLQHKIAKETESVRKAEDNKRDRQLANRKEEDVALKDSLHKNRQTRLLHLSNFILTTDPIHPPDRDSSPELEPPGPENDEDAAMRDDAEPKERKPPTGPRAERNRAKDPLAGPARSHPPPIYFLPAILLPSQRERINKRKEAVKAALEQEQITYVENRRQAVEEIKALRAKVEAVDEELKAMRQEEAGPESATTDRPGKNDRQEEAGDGEGRMDVESDLGDEPRKETRTHQRDRSRSRSRTPPKRTNAMDEDDAVEY